jgi:cysteinyl-tRNA synthetase
VNGQLDGAGAKKVLETLSRLNTVVNIFDFEDQTQDPAVQQLMDERDHARQEKNWALADQLRDQLKAMGVVVRDEKAGK